MGSYKIGGVPIEEIMKKPVFVDLSARMEALFSEVHGDEDAKELMAIYGILTAGLIKFYANNRSRTTEQELEEFTILVEYCLKGVTVVRQTVH